MSQDNEKQVLSIRRLKSVELSKMNLLHKGKYRLLYLESQNNQKQPEISKRKSLSIRIF